MGSFTGKQKQFKLSVRAKQEGIEQIPALEFSWFDPEKEKYVTTSSKPIALQVMPAQIVTAANVFSGSTASSEQTTGTANGEDKGSLGSKSISLIGANLAIEQSAEKLQGRSQLLLNATWFSYAMYPLGVLSLAVALILRQGKTRDPRKTQALQRLRRWRQQLSSARHLPLQAAAEAIGGAAREMLPYLSASSRTTADELIAECDALAYAGNVPDDQARAQQLAERALSIVSEVQ